MNKKQEKRLVYVILTVSIIVLASLLMPVFLRGDISYSGYQVALGYEISNVEIFNLGSIINARLPINILAIFAYALIISATALILFKRSLLLWSAIGYIAAGVIFLILPHYSPIEFEIAGNVSQASVNWSFGYGLLIATIGSFISGFLSLIISIK